MVVFDSSVLFLTFDPTAKPPNNPETGEPIIRAAERVDYLIATLSKARETIIIPTPVMSEVLVRAGAAMSDIVTQLNTQSVFRVVPFDQKAAIEAAIAVRSSLDRGGIRVDATTPDVARSKVKFDRQIMAIALAEQAHTIYSDDHDIIKYSEQAKLKCISTAALDLPPEDPQQSIDFGDLESK